MRKFLACVFMLAACGDDGTNKLPDAPTPTDAAVDAAPDTPVALTITRDGLPVPNIDVYFLDPDGSLVAKVPTGVTGVASAIVLAGGTVTAVDPFVVPVQTFGGAIGVHRDLRTFAGVQPGDQLELTENGGRSTAITVTVSAPADGAADGYTVFSTCGGEQAIGAGGSGSPPSGSVVLSGCGATTDVVVMSYTQGVATGWFFKADVAVADQGVLDFTGETYQLPTDTVFTFNNVPAAFLNINFQALLATAKGVAWRQFDIARVLSGVGTQTVPLPAVPNLGLVTRALLLDNTTEHELLFWGPQATTTFDLAAKLLPEFTSQPLVTVPAHTAAWTSTGGEVPDLTVANIYVTNQTDSYSWEMVAPYAGPQVTFPALPAGVLPFVATAADFASVDFLVTARVPGGYDAVRAKALSMQDVTGLVAGPTGNASTAVYSLGKVARRGRDARPVGFSRQRRR